MAFASKAKVINFNAEEAAKRGGVLWFCANIAGFALAITNLNGVRSLIDSCFVVFCLLNRLLTCFVLRRLSFVLQDIEKEKCIRDILASEEVRFPYCCLYGQAVSPNC
jgi:hypothetical protein